MSILQLRRFWALPLLLTQKGSGVGAEATAAVGHTCLCRGTATASPSRNQGSQRGAPAALQTEAVRPLRPSPPPPLLRYPLMLPKPFGLKLR